MKATYVHIKKPIEVMKFILYTAPMGWYRIDILKKKLRDDPEFKAKFTEEELNYIEGLE